MYIKLRNTYLSSWEVLFFMSSKMILAFYMNIMNGCFILKEGSMNLVTFTELLWCMFLSSLLISFHLILSKPYDKLRFL